MNLLEFMFGYFLFCTFFLIGLILTYLYRKNAKVSRKKEYIASIFFGAFVLIGWSLYYSWNDGMFPVKIHPVVVNTGAFIIVVMLLMAFILKKIGDKDSLKNKDIITDDAVSLGYFLSPEQVNNLVNENLKLREELEELKKKINNKIN